MENARLARISAQLDGALIALDFDGTLAPLVPDPALSAAAPGAVKVLTQLAEAGAQIAIVTGRDALTALKLSTMADLPGLIVNGLHGAEVWRAGLLRTQDEPAGIATLRVELPALLSAVDEQIWLEDKRLSLVVHTRRAAEPEQALERLRPIVTAHADRAGLQVHPGHLVLEIRLAGFSKADAMTELLRPETTAVLYAGDDHGDLPAMQAVRGWAQQTGRPAITVGIGELPALDAAADLRLKDPAALVRALEQLLPSQ